MWRKLGLIATFLVLSSSAPLYAADLAASPSDQQEQTGTWAGIRTAVLLPFKGVGCVVGAFVPLSAHLLSGLQPDVKEDAETVWSTYCNQAYLTSPRWEK